MAKAKTAKSSPTPNSLSLRVQKLRLDAGLTQRQLADRLRTTPGYVGGIETHPNFDPKVSTLRKIAVALGVDVIELLRDDEVALK